jgi:hypothetical protein
VWTVIKSPMVLRSSMVSADNVVIWLEKSRNLSANMHQD